MQIHLPDLARLHDPARLQPYLTLSLDLARRLLPRTLV